MEMESQLWTFGKGARKRREAPEIDTGTHGFIGQNMWIHAFVLVELINNMYQRKGADLCFSLSLSNPYSLSTLHLDYIVLIVYLHIYLPNLVWEFLRHQKWSTLGTQQIFVG